MSLETEIVGTTTASTLLRTDWDLILRENKDDSFYLSFDWFHAALHLFHVPPRNLRVICIRDSGKIIAIIPCCLSKRRLRVFSVRTLELIGNICSPIRGFVVAKSREKEVAEALLDFLMKDPMWDLIHFEDMSRFDPFLAEIDLSLKRRRVRVRAADLYDNLIIDLSSIHSSQEYWNRLSSNLRQTVRTGINRINMDSNFRITLLTDTCQDIDKAMKYYYDIYVKSWKINAADPHFHHKLAKYLVLKGWLRLFILYLDTDASSGNSNIYIDSYKCSVDTLKIIPENCTPIAAHFFVVHGRYAYFLKTAYREDYSRYSPGAIMKWFALKWLIDEDKVTMVDLQKDNDSYKFKWGRFNEKHIKYQAANPNSFPAMLELWSERHVIPLLRHIKGRLRRSPGFFTSEPGRSDSDHHRLSRGIE